MAARHEALRGERTASGELAGGAGLVDPQQTVTLRIRDGEVAATTGPLFEPELVLSAYYEVECETRERAAEIAAKVLDFHVLAVEVRGIHDTAEAALERDQRSA